MMIYMKTADVLGYLDNSDKLFRDTNIAWGIEQLSPIVAAIVAIGLAYWGYKQTLKTQAKDYQHQFQMKMYEQIIDAIEIITKKTGEYTGLLNSFSSNVYMDYHAVKGGHKKLDWGHRPNDYHEKHFSFLASLTNVMKIIENVRIIEPKLVIFNIALSSVHHDVSNSYQEMTDYFYRYSPKEIIDKSGQKVLIEAENLDEKTMNEIQAKIDIHVNKLVMDATCYTMDLKVDLQNILLGDVYTNNRVQHRKPIDPKVIVVTTENFDSLKEYFRKNTKAGREQSALEEKLATQYKK